MQSHAILRSSLRAIVKSIGHGPSTANASRHHLGELELAWEKQNLGSLNGQRRRLHNSAAAPETESPQHGSLHSPQERDSGLPKRSTWLDHYEEEKPAPDGAGSSHSVDLNTLAVEDLGSRSRDPSNEIVGGAPPNTRSPPDDPPHKEQSTLFRSKARSVARYVPSNQVARYIRSLEHRSAARTHGRQRIHAKQVAIREEAKHGSRLNDWRSILAMMDKSTTPGAVNYVNRAEIVDLPDGVSATFKGSSSIAILEIMQRTGCHVQAVHNMSSPATSDGDSFRALALRGSPTQRASALKILPSYLHTVSNGGRNESPDIKDYVFSYREHLRTGVDAGEPPHIYEGSHGQPTENNDGATQDIHPPLDENRRSALERPMQLRSIWTTDRVGRKPPSEISGHQNDPPRWTTTDLMDHVVNLVETSPRLLRRNQQRDIPVPERSEHDAVVTKLISLFADPEVVKVASSEVIDRALGFCVNRPDLRAARKIFVSLENGGYKVSPSTFDVLFAGAEGAYNVSVFGFLLKMMLDRRLQPGPRVWSIFHRLVHQESPAEAKGIALRMSQRGLLADNKSAVAVAWTAVELDLREHLDAGGDPTTFVQSYDKLFAVTYGIPGFDWMHIDVVNRMILVLVEVGRMQSAVDVLDEYRRRRPNGIVSNVTLNNFLRPTWTRPKDAVAVLQMFEVGRRFSLLPDAYTFAILFRIAWNRRYYNMTRVIWRYACAAGHVRPQMIHRMASSLRLPAPTQQNDDGLTENAVFRAWAGKFAVGVTDDLTLRDVWTEPLLNDHPDIHFAKELRQRRVSKMALSARESGWHGRGTKLSFQGSKHLQPDLNACTKYMPTIPLVDIVKRAVALDSEWEQRRLDSGQRMSESAMEARFETMLEEGIRVPMVQGDGTRIRRDWDIPHRQ